MCSSSSRAIVRDMRGSRVRPSLWRRLDDHLGPLSSDGVDPLPNGAGRGRPWAWLPASQEDMASLSHKQGLCKASEGGSCSL